MTHPSVSTPEMPTIPTIDQILGPLFDTFHIPTVSFSTTGTCPTFEFTYADETFVANGHCALIDNIRPVLQAMMMALYSGLVLLIVLSA
jgi:hypothetical protein